MAGRRAGHVGAGLFPSLPPPALSCRRPVRGGHVDARAVSAGRAGRRAPRPRAGRDGTGGNGRVRRERGGRQRPPSFAAARLRPGVPGTPVPRGGAGRRGRCQAGSSRPGPPPPGRGSGSGGGAGGSAAGAGQGSRLLRGAGGPGRLRRGGPVRRPRGRCRCLQGRRVTAGPRPAAPRAAQQRPDGAGGAEPAVRRRLTAAGTCPSSAPRLGGLDVPRPSPALGVAWRRGAEKAAPPAGSRRRAGVLRRAGR